MSEYILTTPNQLSVLPEVFTSENNALFALGDVVRHKQYGYRGLIFDVDASFCQTEEWYELMANSNPPKDVPWYHVIVDGEKHTTYVPQNNLLLSENDDMEIDHPLVPQLFQQSSDGIFLTKKLLN